MSSTMAGQVLGVLYAIFIVLLAIFAALVAHVRRHWDD